ncbi:DUF2141 domain-containing protein [Hymenobacter sp. BT175]|uniref:DUF2141 domain-containing protein n=1 Tax=Hymenobacter translucens TaxID=2886507 RepID=UPI001D0E1C07|nr:DUF2141 domain-containing protein [Hymenobacter translucens]MCC2545444.1 DUF2141 domain-containing protein [Hymenobacter translucens]
MTILEVAFFTASSFWTSPAPAPAPTTEVRFVVTDLPSVKSTVKLYFYNVEDSFLKVNRYAFMRRLKPDGQNRVVVPVDLPPGEWAVALTQDTNNNDRLDKNMMGIPTEPYAFSNNIRPKFSAPGFDECKFVVKGPAQVVTISMKN